MRKIILKQFSNNSLNTLHQTSFYHEKKRVLQNNCPVIMEKQEKAVLMITQETVC